MQQEANDSRSGPSIEDGLFFFDTLPLTSWPISITQYTTSSHPLGVSSSDSELYKEPPYDPDEDYVEPGAKQCFNCMSTKHVVSDCPRKRNTQHIALARAEYGSRSGGSRKVARLHEAEEDIERRMEFVRIFEPGYIVGEALRESLGLVVPYDGRNEDLPWYEGMCEWGYPPGWVSFADPRHQVLERIEAARLCEPADGSSQLVVFESDDEPSESRPDNLQPVSPRLCSLSPKETDDVTLRENEQHLLPGASFTAMTATTSDLSLGVAPPHAHSLSLGPISSPRPETPSAGSSSGLSIGTPLPPLPSSTPPPDVLPFPALRWAHYRTTSFQSDRLPVSLVTQRLAPLEESFPITPPVPPPPPPPSSPPPPPPPVSPPPLPPNQLPEETSEQERRKLLWARILAGQAQS